MDPLPNDHPSSESGQDNYPPQGPQGLDHGSDKRTDFKDESDLNKNVSSPSAECRILLNLNF